MSAAYTLVTSDTAGTVLLVNVANGDRLGAGGVTALLDCMKMEIPVTAPVAGTIHDLTITAGDAVTEGQPLARIGR